MLNLSRAFIGLLFVNYRLIKADQNLLRSFSAHKIPEYNFDKLDKFLDHLMEIRLMPVIEFMSEIFPKQNRFHDLHFMWKDLTYQLMTHYLCKFKH